MKKLLILLGVVGVSLSAPLVRLSSAPSMVLVLYRVAMAAVLLLPYALLRSREELRRMSRKTLALCLLSGLFLGLHFTLYFEAIRHTSIASAVALVDTEVFFVAFLMLFLLLELFPVDEHLVRIFDVNAAEHVRMAEYHLVGNARSHVAQ